MLDMPTWVEIVIAAGAVVTAAYAVWGKVIWPSIQFGTMLERVLPAMVVLAEAFPKEEDLEEWLEAIQSHKSWAAQRIAAIERVIDYEHPPPRDWDWQHPPERRHHEIPPEEERRDG